VIRLPRSVARRFLAVLRRSLGALDPHGAPPCVRLEAGPGGLTLSACVQNSAVLFRLPGVQEVGSLAFPIRVLSDFADKDHAHACLEQVGDGKGSARWEEDGVPRSCEFEITGPDSLTALPTIPRKLASPGPGFLAALGEAARTCARDAARYALTRLLLQGKEGKLVATDGRQLLVQGGFAFPWVDDVLLPALPVFAGRELASEDVCEVGRRDSHVALKVGPWLFVLGIDRDGRFPRYQEVIPQPRNADGLLQVDEQDAAFLANALPRMPGGEHKEGPVTLELGPTVCVRSKADDTDTVAEGVLCRSRYEGPLLRLFTNRLYLLRAVKLGFREVRVKAAGQPLVCQDRSRTFVWMPLDVTGAVPTTPNVSRVLSTSEPPTPQPKPRRTPAMPAPSDNRP
jgi:hypothetical protein